MSISPRLEAAFMADLVDQDLKRSLSAGRAIVLVPFHRWLTAGVRWIIRRVVNASSWLQPLSRKARSDSYHQSITSNPRVHHPDR